MDTINVPVYVHAGGANPMPFAAWSTLLGQVQPCFAQAGIRFLSDAAHYAQFPGSMIALDDDAGQTDPAKREANVQARLTVAADHPDRLCVFLASDGGGYGRGEFGVLMRLVGSQAFDAVAHELGHTLNLHHNFGQGWCDVAPGGSTPNALAADAEEAFPALLAGANNDLATALTAVRRRLEHLLDGDAPETRGAYAVSDTPFSIQEIHSDQQKHQNDADFVLHVDFKATVPGQGTTVHRVDLRPDRTNFMGYWGAPLRDRFTPQQINRMRSTLTRGSLARVVDNFHGYLDPPMPAVVPAGALSWVAALADGSVPVVFDVGADRRVRMHAKRAGSPGWLPPTDLGGNAASRPAACSWGGGNCNLFIREVDGSFWSKAATNSNWWPGQYDWNALGGLSEMSPVCVADRPGRVLVFGVGTDAKLYVNVWDDKKGGRWSGWVGLGGSLLAPPAVISSAPGHVDVVAVFTDGSVQTKSFDEYAWAPSQAAWTPLGGKVRYRPALASWAPGRLDVFAVGTDGGVYSKLRDNGKWWPGQTGWHRIDQTLISIDGAGQFIRGDRVWSTPLALAPKFGELQLWAVDMRSQELVRNVWTRAKNAYHGWERLGGHLAGPLAGVLGPGGVAQIVARYCDGTTWHRSPSQDWSRVDELQQT